MATEQELSKGPNMGHQRESDVDPALGSCSSMPSMLIPHCLLLKFCAPFWRMEGFILAAIRKEVDLPA